MNDLFIEAWGTGAPVVLVHGSLATGAEKWQAQQPLAEEGYQLLVLDRRGYGKSPAVEGEDFLRDAADIAHVIGDGAHVVAHSYGGLGAMFAAAQQPEAIHSLALLEPAARTLASTDAARDLVDAIPNMWDQDLPDKVWPAPVPGSGGNRHGDPARRDSRGAAPLVPVLRKGRPAWDREPPVAELAAARFPKLVVSGGHSEGFEAICDELADQIGAARAVVERAGHEIQFTGAPINDALRNLWTGAG